LGTSKNVASPRTPPWRPVLAVLGRPDIPAERQAREIWLGASADRGSRLLDDLSQSTLAAACQLAQRSTDASAAVREYDSMSQRAGRVGFAIELGKRALARSVANRSSSSGFATELFSEATAYYASRDLASLVASRGRIETTSAAIDLKKQLREITREKIRALGSPKTDPRGWGHFVQEAVSVLRGGR
jgi:hypothetical protein